MEKESCIPEEIKNTLAERYKGYVLITCDDSDDSGKMSVEMSYSGDPILASYLLESAPSFIDVDDVESLEKES